MEQLEYRIYQRVFGRPSTRPPGNSGCWKYRNNTIIVDLSLTRELSKSGGAIYLYDKIFGEELVPEHVAFVVLREYNELELESLKCQELFGG